MRRKTIKIILVAVLFACQANSSFAGGTETNLPSIDHSNNTNLKGDEKVLLFPTNAKYDPDKKQWIIPVHGWVFEPEADSAWRNAIIKAFEETIGIEENSIELQRFKQRTRMFLVDNERSKNIYVKIGNQQFGAPETEANGHFIFSAYITSQNTCDEWINIHVVTNQDDHRQFSGKAQCVKNSGISVISDIDDTIKDSNVLDKNELIKNTFLKEFKPVPGMSHLYKHWHQQGHKFHYVSSSPWQLYPALSQFLSDEQFPLGSMHLKLVRLKDNSLYSLFESPEEGKIPIITKLLTTYPQRKFILVGDSGEKDPEIYAEIARQFPERIVKIYIHDIRKDKQRLTSVFKHIENVKWVAFTNANDLLNNPQIMSLK